MSKSHEKELTISIANKAIYGYASITKAAFGQPAASIQK